MSSTTSVAPPAPRAWQLLRTYLGPQQGRVALLAACLFGMIALQLCNPQVIRYFIDATQTGSAQGPLLLAGIAFIAAGASQRLLGLASVYLGERVGWDATNALRADLARHCLRLDMGFHKQRTPGELIERIDGDVTALSNFFSQFSLRLLGNGVLLLGILVLLFQEDWRAGLAMLAYASVTLLGLHAVQRFGVSRWEAARQAQAEQFGFIEERMNGTEDLRAAGAEAHTLRQLDSILERTLRADRNAYLVSNLTFVVSNFLLVLGYSLGLALGAYLYTSGSVSLGAAFVIVYYIGLLSAPLEQIREQVQDLQQAGASVGRVSELFAFQPLVREDPQATLPTGALPVALDAVWFGYADSASSQQSAVSSQQSTVGGLHTADRPLATADWPLATDPVINNLSLNLAPGTVLGLLGRTGSGKTTLTRLLFRLYDPTSGSIRLGGIDLRALALADLRARVALVTQEVQLFQASVRDNLALFNRQIDDAAIERALRELGLWEWATGLPQGLATRLGAGGIGLSAGEAQLLAFARVFLRDPGLVILDEASSRLDPATERLLDRAITRLLRGRTAIVIAHRLGTIQRADQILILDNGQIAEYGQRALLASNPNSRFAALLRVGLEEALV